MKLLLENTLKGVLTITFVLLAEIITGQTTYYVRNGGDDNADGTTDAKAWATISEVNKRDFSPGDSILFKRGDRFFGYLRIDDSGNPSNHITFSSYGSGEKPKLFGSKELTSFIPHGYLANVYVCENTMAINPNDYDGFPYPGSIWFDVNDSITWGDGDDDYVSGLNNLNRNFQWTWQNDSLYFYYNENIDNVKTVEATQLARGIDIGAEYITLDGLNMRYYGSRCVGHPTQPEVTKKGLIIRNGEFAYTGSKDQGVGFGLSLIHSNSLIEHNKIHANGRRNVSIYIQNYASKAVIRDMIIQNNELYDAYHSQFDLAIHGNYAQMKNIVIRNNKIWEWASFDKPDNYEANFVNMINNGLSDNYDSIFIYNNEMCHFKGSAFFIMDVKNLYIMNNSMTASQYDFAAFFYMPKGDQGNTVIMNNIMQNHTDAGSFINGSPDLIPDYKFDTVNYNLYHSRTNSCYLMENNPKSSGDNHRYTEWNTYKSHGYEDNGIYNSYPHFIDSLCDLRLRSTSPAIGAGVPISFITTDILGNPRSEVAPTMGAYEFMGIDSSSVQIYRFTIPNQISSIVNKVANTITVSMPFGTDRSNLRPSITNSEGSTVSPTSGETVNFNSPVIYTVTSLDGTKTQDWTVTVEIVEKPKENTLPVTDYTLKHTTTTKGIVQTIDASSSFDDDSDQLTFNWIIPPGLSCSPSLTEPSVSILPPAVESYTIELRVSDGKGTVSTYITVDVENFNATAQELEISSIEASNFLENNYPEHIVDGSLQTQWAAEGDGQWLIFELAEMSTLSHFELSFFLGDRRQAYFDIYASTDKENWDLVRDNSTSCGFSPDMHSFEVPQTKASEKYKYIKLVGHMNSENSWNSFTEFKIFGNNTTQGFLSNDEINVEDIIEVYPNPTTDNVFVKTDSESSIRIIDMSGAVLYEQKNNTEITEIDYNFVKGIYFIQVNDGNNKVVTKQLIVK